MRAFCLLMTVLVTVGLADGFDITEDGIRGPMIAEGFKTQGFRDGKKLYFAEGKRAKKVDHVVLMEDVKLTIFTDNGVFVITTPACTMNQLKGTIVGINPRIVGDKGRMTGTDFTFFIKEHKLLVENVLLIMEGSIDVYRKATLMMKGEKTE